MDEQAQHAYEVHQQFLLKTLAARIVADYLQPLSAVEVASVLAELAMYSAARTAMHVQG